jgi:DNA (cytosine-5)-methyltransferase 1
VRTESANAPRPGFYEFFAGGGMARTGLGPGWDCLFANDVDPAKARAYRENFGPGAFMQEDIAALTAEDLPGRADLMWGSFPCQDLSLAGGGAGLGGRRSGLFWSFWRLVEALDADGRAPRLVVIEKVVGALSARDGRDFAAICAAFTSRGYRAGALVIDAALFTPQSRPRLFVIGAREPSDAGLALSGPSPPFHPQALERAVARLDAETTDSWRWWRLPEPPPRRSSLADVLEPDGPEVVWSEPEATARLLALMAPAHLAQLRRKQASGARHVGCVYRRTRGEGLAKVQRAEVRFDGVAGCLRTPAGGSSRQTLLVVDGEQVRSRLLTPRETARLMGLPESYRLPQRATAAYHLTGDGVAAPVVRHLSIHLFAPLLAARPEATAAAARGSGGRRRAWSPRASPHAL